MREIEFRGINYYSGKWIYGSLVLFKPKAPEIYDFKNDSIEIVIEETVGQYTGLKDKNGVKIYEGDKVRVFNHQSNGSEYFKCEYKLEKQGFRFISLTHNDDGWYILEGNNDIEVIGNIHEEAK